MIEEEKDREHEREMWRKTKMATGYGTGREELGKTERESEGTKNSVSL